MKKICFFLMLTFAVNAAWSQTTYTWEGGASASWQVPGNWAPDRNTPATSDILVFNTSSTHTVTNMPTAQTIGRLVIANGTTVRLESVGGLQTLRIGSGAANAPDELVVEAGSTLIQVNTFNEIYLQNNGTADISGTYRIEAAEGFYLTNSGVVARVSGRLVSTDDNIEGASTTKLIFNNGGVYDHEMNGGEVPTATWNAGSLCEISGMTNDYPNNMGQTFQSVLFNSTITDDVEMETNLTCLQNLTIAIGFGPGDEFRGTNGNGDRDISVGGKFTLSSGTFNFDSGNGGSEFTVSGGFELAGGTFTEDGSGSATVIFGGTAVQPFIKAAAATISGTVHFTVNNNAKVDFGTSVLNGSGGTFTLNAGGKIITANANGLAATGSVQITRVFNSGADYEFQGATTGNFTTSADPQVRNMTINRAAGVTLSKAMTVNQVLELTNGYLTTTPTNLLTIAAAGSTTYTTAFVDGPLAKVFGAANVGFTFPVGTVAGGIRTIGATTVTTAGASATTFTARFFSGSPKSAYPNATFAGGIEQISNCEYWTLDRQTGGTRYQARVTLSWSAASNCGSGAYVTNPAALVVARHNGGTPGSWTNAGYSGHTTSSVTSLALNNFSPFALGTIDGDANPLPVVFGDVKAYEKNDGVQIEWANLTEKDVAEYAIERSANGKDFSAIATQLPSSNQNDKASYTGFDAAPNAGVNYYRIKATETTGKIVYSKILTVQLGKSDASLRLYPNPVSGNQVTLSLSNMKHGQYNIRVVNAAGQDIFKQVISNRSNNMTQTLDLPASIKPGLYNLIIAGDNYRATKTFIVQ